MGCPWDGSLRGSLRDGFIEWKMYLLRSTLMIEREITNSSLIRSFAKLGDRVNKIVEVRGRVSSSSRFPLAKLDENREKRLKSMVRDR